MDENIKRFLKKSKCLKENIVIYSKNKRIGAQMQKGSYTIEASVYVPMIMFLMLIIIRGGISFYKESKNREVYEGLMTIDAVSEFYTYQMISSVGGEKSND